MINIDELGELEVTADGVVLFSMASIRRLAEKLDVTVETLIARYSGCKCEGLSPGTATVERVTSVTEEGDTKELMVIGGIPNDFLRFLGVDEQTFREYFDEHPYREFVGSGPTFNRTTFEEIVADYRNKLRG